MGPCGNKKERVPAGAHSQNLSSSSLIRSYENSCLLHIGEDMRKCNSKRMLRRGGACRRRVSARDGGGAGARSGRRNLRRARGRLERRRLGEVQRRLDNAAALPCELRRQRRRRPPQPVARLRQRAAGVRLPHRARPDQRRDPRQLAGTHPPSPGRGLRRRRTRQVRARRARPGFLGPGLRRHPRRAPVADDHHRRRRIRRRPRSSCAAAAEAAAASGRGASGARNAAKRRARRASAQEVGSL